MQGVPATEATKHTFQASSGHGRVLEGGKLLSEAAFAAAFLPAAPFAPAFPFSATPTSSSSISSSLFPGLPAITLGGGLPASPFVLPSASSRLLRRAHLLTNLAKL